MKNLTNLTIWQDLSAHHKEIADQHMRDWFANDTERFTHFTIQQGGLLLDYSRNRISQHTINLLSKLAETVDLRSKMQELFAGSCLNNTENRPALHTALRDPHSKLALQGQNISATVTETQQKLTAFADSIHSGKWKGATGKAIQHIVNIGIGGSHLGPMMAAHALADYAASSLQFHFISSVDKTNLENVWAKIDPATTLFIISSKSFNTIETLTNARTIFNRMEKLFEPTALKQHFVAVTAAPDKAVAFGIPAQQIFPMWEWVGGRYSVWSAVGLPLLLMIGTQAFNEFLAGAYEMDQHFLTADWTDNMPVLMALLGIWYRNFFAATNHAIIPYAHALRDFIPYIQQADMESNGKSISKHGTPLDYPTSPVVFGLEGCDGQHAYHQLLHQGQHFIPADFILVNKPADIHQRVLIASGLSQAQALMQGKTYEQAYAELLAKNVPTAKAAELAQHLVIPGNKPSNILILDALSPKNLGALIALYEHKIFVQGVIWGINSFDQWGVELGKQLLPGILKHLQEEQHVTELDSATAGLIAHFKKIQGQTC